MNTHQNQIAQIFETAQSSIQVAVSWFTDTFLIEKLIQKSKKVKVEVLLSSDKWNLHRHHHFRQLQDSGKVQKLGTENALLGNFMHSKFIIIDGRLAYGGSYNFTENAKTNYENFRKYDYGELASISADFSKWFKESQDFFAGITDPEEELRLLECAEIQKQRQLLPKTQYNNVAFSESVYIERKEKEVEKVISHRQTANNLVSGTIKISSEGKTTAEKGVSMPQHRNYGGSSFAKYAGEKLPNSYALALYQKRVIEKNYTFLKCRIENDTLICVGEVQPDNCEKYKIRIEFRAGHHPRVFILSPNIEIRPEIHIYREGNLCLFYPPDMKWKDTTKIAEYTIPWTIEWIILYELWKLTGKWEGAEKLHKPLRPVRKNNSI